MGFTALIAGGLGAAGSIGSALIGSNASKNAANAQLQAQQSALAQQQALYQQGLSTAKGALNPFINAGQGAASTLSGLLTPGTSAAALAQMPGFQFQSQYGTMAAQNALAGKTGPSAGPLATAISQYNNGLAGTQYFNTVGALQNLTNTGANAAGTLGSAALGAGVNSGNAQASTIGNMGNAQASGILGSANALGNGLTGVAGAGNNALLYNALLGQNGGGGLYSGASYGGGNFLTDAFGGNANNPLAGLNASDYG
jgi:hypothetical protein